MIAKVNLKKIISARLILRRDKERNKNKIKILNSISSYFLHAY